MCVLHDAKWRDVYFQGKSSPRGEAGGGCREGGGRVFVLKTVSNHSENAKNGIFGRFNLYELDISKKNDFLKRSS